MADAAVVAEEEPAPPERGRKRWQGKPVGDLHRMAMEGK
jgi:hypothetical protein